MRTTLYLIRHAHADLYGPAASAAADPALTPLGRRQAALTRDFLAVRSIDACYCAPVRRAEETAALIAAAHGLAPQALASLHGLTATSFAAIRAQVVGVYGRLLEQHAGEGIVVVASRIVQASYLAALLDLTPDAAARLPLDQGGISVVVHAHAVPRLSTLNSIFHLQGAAAVDRRQPLAA